MDSWDSSYAYAQKLFSNATGYDDEKAKAKTLKMAWNTAFGLPDWYPGRKELMTKIENYAYRCGIDLSKISGYEY